MHNELEDVPSTSTDDQPQPAPQEFEANPGRGRTNSAFFSVMGGYLNWHMHKGKAKAFADLSPNVVELGSGVGANLRYLPSGRHRPRSPH